MLSPVITRLGPLRQFLIRPGAGLRAVFCLLMVSFLLSGLPGGNLHRHAASEHGHDHAAMSQVVVEHDEHAAASEANEGLTSLHFHEAASFAQALPDLFASTLISLPVATLDPLQPVRGPRLTPRPPPHRPPIA